MSKHTFKSSILVVLSLLLFLFASSCGPVNSVGAPSTNSHNDTSDKTEASKSKSTLSTTDTTASSSTTTKSTVPTTSPGTSSTLLVTTSNSSSASSSGSSDETKPTGSRPIVTDDKDHPLVTLAWTEIFEQVNPSVAMIRLTIPASSIYEKREETFSALIIDEEGLLISSYSMFEKAVDYRGILMDGASVEVYVDAYTKPFPATMYGFDTMSDIALLKVEPDSRKLTAQALSRKSEVKVGLPVGVITA
ncbi:MAG: S1C family serine protease, partial [Eubacteriales bacterium]|nr:S1C family serine protease [Eubacteriales bacterium]